MKMLDLFSGLGGWSSAFKARGHEVVTVDLEPSFQPTVCADIMQLTAKDLHHLGPFDIVTASPMCNCFSVMTISRHWSIDGKPNPETKDSIRMVGHTVDLILNLFPRWWVLENPMGMMRHVLGKPSATTYFASWGDLAYKPTDLWGVLPKTVEWKKPRNWQKASRGSQAGGTQAKPNAAERARIPYGLSLALCLACEKELAALPISLTVDAKPIKKEST
jgi:hypothetical protein